MTAGGVTAPRLASGLGAVAAQFDGLLVDQWGVLHDGVTPYPGVRDCLERLAALGKRVVVLSNSGRRAAPNRRLMAEIGFPETSYTALVTSGEVAWEAFKDRTDPFVADLGRRCLLFSRQGDRSIVEGLDLEPVVVAEEAEFILVSGSDAPGNDLADYEAALAAGAARGLPLVCANPDLVRVSPDGLLLGPGSIARRYEELGGRVRWIGKPHGEIYRAALAALGGVPRHRVAAVGDSLQHDIAGGKAAGLATVLVTGGIHREDFAGARNAQDCVAALRALGAGPQAWPDWIIPAVVW
jgi:HAD superfamily hydrolase (TIGR01459 family)